MAVHNFSLAPNRGVVAVQISATPISGKPGSPLPGVHKQEWGQSNPYSIAAEANGLNTAVVDVDVANPGRQFPIGSSREEMPRRERG